MAHYDYRLTDGYRLKHRREEMERMASGEVQWLQNLIKHRAVGALKLVRENEIRSNTISALKKEVDRLVCTSNARALQVANAEARVKATEARLTSLKDLLNAD